MSGWKFYYPPIFFWWWFVYDAYAPQVFVEGAFIAASGTVASIAAAIGMSVWRAREAKNVETYGSARWARPDEVKSAGLLGPDGVVRSSIAEPESTVADARLRSCVSEAVRRWAFPAVPNGGLTVVSYPFVFAPAGG